ncbi:MAG: hypothetical protein PHY73_02065 [Candidatus Omnitrophica bacterium]|nr:hypothetical protein [Candidatus Omnitrophota bacterium]
MNPEPLKEYTDKELKALSTKELKEWKTHPFTHRFNADGGTWLRNLISRIDLILDEREQGATRLYRLITFTIIFLSLILTVLYYFKE